MNSRKVSRSAANPSKTSKRTEAAIMAARPKNAWDPLDELRCESMRDQRILYADKHHLSYYLMKER